MTARLMLLLALALTASAQHTFDLAGADDPQPVDGMVSNSVTQLEVGWVGSNPVVWGSNSFGVLHSTDLGQTFQTYESVAIMPQEGGVSGLAVGNQLVAIATVIDTSIAGVQGAGGGIAYTLDQGSNWTWLPQPMDCYVEGASNNPADRIAVSCYDSSDTLEYIGTPTTTTVQNITYELSVEGDSAIWAASFAGGFRRYSLATGQWRNHVVDSNPFDPVANLNHRAFSVLSADGGVWAGSAGGLNFMPRGGTQWTHFDYQHPQENGEPTITGNWVVVLKRQALDGGGEAIWVGGWATFATVGDYYGLSYTTDDGASWTVIHDMQDHKIWDIAFNGNDVWVATDDGLFKSNQGGADGSWNRYPEIKVVENGVIRREMLVDEIYAVEFVNGQLLVGCTRGLFFSADGGASWGSTWHQPSAARFFPNPFSPAAFVQATLSVDLPRAGSVTVKLFDFAMDPVKVVADGVSLPAGTSELYWDGRNRQGDLVANGVYFYSIEGPGLSSWGKLMVIR
ncbi:MAG: hypothetical protein H6678_15535 [Candidatus Delongbacteria bacterium]|nr:hypothetical protein [Candidatus Delongbacteria bacterium]